MKQVLPGYIRSVALLLVAFIVGAACTGPGEPNPSPTASAAPALPPTTILTAIEIAVERHRGENRTSLAKGQVEDIQKDDRILVAEKGWGQLLFTDRLKVELHHDTQLSIDDVSVDLAQGSIFLRMKQTIGSSRVELSQAANDRVELVTDHATLTSVGSPTVFMVCHAEPVTCMFTEAGEVAVRAQGVEVMVPAGMGTYILAGEPPQPPICGDMEEFRSWLEEQRRAQTDEPLVALVQRWTETDPCGTTSLPAADGMVPVPAGHYEIGHEQGDEYHLAATPIELDAFWIDAYEVTNAQYQAFVGDTGHPAPLGWPGGIYPPGLEAHPVKGVTWDDASAYCAWVHKRLPSEKEWEVAARGPELPPLLYPWGSDSFAAGEINNLPRDDTYAVGSVPFNRSPFGVYDMAVNVWEWVGEPYGPVAEGNKILRGGRHGLLRDMAYRQPAAPADPRLAEFAGFRCAANQVEGG